MSSGPSSFENVPVGRFASSSARCTRSRAACSTTSTNLPFVLTLDCPTSIYPLDDKTIGVTRCGRICLGKKEINFSQVFAGQAVGTKEVPRRYLAGQLYGL